KPDDAGASRPVDLLSVRAVLAVGRSPPQDARAGEGDAMKMGLCLAVALATAVGAAQEPRPQSQRPPVFRANVDAVRIDVQATADGKPIAGLTPDDFEVRDNGVLQTVDLATTAGSLSVV